MSKYDPDYIQSKIDLAKKTFENFDADQFEKERHMSKENEKENFYQTSTDYERLYDLLIQGKTVVCFVDYSFVGSKYPPCRDVCKASYKEGRFKFSARGIGYEPLNYNPTKQDFLDDCEGMNVEFIDSSSLRAEELQSENEKLQSQYEIMFEASVKGGKELIEKDKEIERLNASLRAEVGQWIRVEDSLPTENGWYEITAFDQSSRKNKTFVAWFENVRFWIPVTMPKISDTKFWTVDAIAWRVLPQAYEAGEK